MPIYTIRDNSNSSRQYEVNLKWNELQTMLYINPHLEQIIVKAPSIGDSVRLGIRRTDDGFNDMLKSIKKRNYGSNIETR